MGGMSIESITEWRRVRTSDLVRPIEPNQFRRMHQNVIPEGEEPPDSPEQFAASGRRIYDVGTRIDITRITRGFGLEQWLPRGYVAHRTIALEVSISFDPIRYVFKDQHLVTSREGVVFEYIIKTNGDGSVLDQWHREVSEANHANDPISLSFVPHDGRTRAWRFSELSIISSNELFPRKLNPRMSPVEVWNA